MICGVPLQSLRRQARTQPTRLICTVVQVLNKVIGIASSPKNRAKVEGEQKAAKPAKVPPAAIAIHVGQRRPLCHSAALCLCATPVPSRHPCHNRLWDF